MKQVTKGTHGAVIVAASLTCDQLRESKDLSENCVEHDM
jgi:hypothetical protein